VSSEAKKINNIVLGIAKQHHGSTVDCMGCNKPIRSGSIAIEAPRFGEEVNLFFY
jgi:hypothetical protein